MIIDGGTLFRISFYILLLLWNLTRDDSDPISDVLHRITGIADMVICLYVGNNHAL